MRILFYTFEYNILKLSEVCVVHAFTLDNDEDWLKKQLVTCCITFYRFVYFRHHESTAQPIGEENNCEMLSRISNTSTFIIRSNAHRKKNYVH